MGALMRRLSSWWVLFAIACIVGLSSALADVPRQFVRPGETTILAEGKEEIALVGTYSSAVRLLKDVGNDGKPVYWVLTYTAANPPTATEDIVAFTKGGKQQSVIVSVSAVPQPNDPSLVSRATRLLFSMVVVAIILESAFAVLFNWRVFLEFFDGRGVRTVLMLDASLHCQYRFPTANRRCRRDEGRCRDARLSRVGSNGQGVVPCWPGRLPFRSTS
jgi:hypothetical protein